MLQAFDNSFSAPPLTRPRWMALLARAPIAMLEQALGAHGQLTPIWLRRPETGLMMVEARTGGTGQRFNLGEVTVTRCALRLPEANGQTTTDNGVVGVAGGLLVQCVRVVPVMLVVRGLQMGRRTQVASVFGRGCGDGCRRGRAVLGGQRQGHEHTRPQPQGQQHQQYPDRPFAHRVMIARTACPLWACAWLLSLLGGGAGLNVRHAGAKNGWLSP